MAITYPLNIPTTIGFESIELRQVNANSVSQSPFTFKQQVINFGGAKWEASVSIPKVHKDLAAPWKAFLIALKGQIGTFLLSDPDYTSPQGTATSCVVTGSLDDESVTVVLDGTLKAGDYIQLGADSSAKLHTVLEDISASGTMEIWPPLRDSYTSSAATLVSPKGLFRLSTNYSSYNINNSSVYGISFDATEALV